MCRRGELAQVADGRLEGTRQVIPRLDDLDVFLKLLPRGTSQRLTAYQSLIPYSLLGVLQVK